MMRTAVLALLVTLAAAAAAPAGDVTVAYYNIKFLDAAALANQGPRLTRLHGVVKALDADAYGLCEIKDRAAVQAVFPPADWDVLIDDDSTDAQDLALVVRKSKLEFVGVPADRDADDAQFLFPTATDNDEFPRRRDVLFAEVKDKASGQSFVMMTVHMKARVGGRNATQWQRVGAANKLRSALEAGYDGKRVVIGGDWNDNPDDRSLNILETGDPNALFGPPPAGAPVLLVNLMEPLLNQGVVTHGKRAADIQANGKINLIDAGSRTRNANGHGKNTNTGDILFDQILVSDEMHVAYQPGSAAVFDGGIAVEGTGDQVASDHLPVLAKFNFPDPTPGGPGGGSTPPAAGVRIAGLLPNPAGDDAGHEEVHLKNTGGAAVTLTGWSLIDQSGNTFPLTGQIAAGGTLVVKLPAGELPLNNTGDTVRLFDPTGAAVHQVTYTKAQATEGTVVTFN